MVKFTLRGLIPPAFTPFNTDFSLNVSLIGDYAEYLAKNKYQGVLINGSTGEGPSMNVSERKLVTEAWMKAGAKHGLHVMVQVGGAPMPDVIELVKHAASVKADSILTLPELYIKPQTVDDLVDYLEVLSKHAPGTPLLYYHIPSLSGVTIHMPSLITAARKRIPSFSGIKFTSNEMAEGTDCLRAGDGHHAVFLGADQILSGAIALGFDSAIGTTYNMLRHGQGVRDSMAEGDYSKARRIQYEMNDILKEATQGAAWVPLTKVLMALLTPIDPGPVRSPMKQLSNAHVESIKAILKKKGLFV